MPHPKLNEIRQFVTTSLSEGSDLRVLQETVLGRKGTLRQFLTSFKDMPVEERAAAGAEALTLRAELEKLLLPTDEVNEKHEVTHVDWSIPISPALQGSIHPVSAMIEEMVDIFSELSFEVAEGAELVSDVENFQYLNMGTDHPARDGHDSFYVTDSLLMRTHTTAVQVLEMQKRHKNQQLPIRVVVPGKTYRRESDQTHSAMFHQFDAVVVDTQTTFADLKGCLDYFAKRLFGDTVETRFRPHHFPFTEPSAEMDIKLKHATGEGKHTKWLEFGGCGMIHPEVLKQAGLNPKIYRGWAFGMSVERPVMLRYQVPDLRLLFSNNPEFLNQFK
ncbi:phenylalanine--tRNA ligase subunit alpha [soil metagenome]